MESKNLIIGAIALVGAVLVYNKFVKKPVLPTLPLAGEEKSNASGGYCKCENGTVGYCQSTCEQCCGSGDSTVRGKSHQRAVRGTIFKESPYKRNSGSLSVNRF